MEMTSAICPKNFCAPGTTAAEIGTLWRISREKARRILHNEPGVICFQGFKNNTREYNTYRVPESVARRVRLRLMNI